LLEFARANNKKLDIKNVEFHKAVKKYRLPAYAPYDRILVSAAAAKLPDDLLEQLKSGGKMVIPVNNDILEVTKNSTNDYEITTHSGFVFVPLTSVKRLEI
jgi:protein-L-isoaspartate(D-aspartate) O-methyltransferase